MEADAVLGEKLERLFEGRQVGRNLTELREPKWPDAAGSCTVAHLAQVVGMGEHQGPVREVEDVEFDEIDTELDRPPEGCERVLRLERGRAAVPDPEYARVAA